MFLMFKQKMLLKACLFSKYGTIFVELKLEQASYLR